LKQAFLQKFVKNVIWNSESTDPRIEQLSQKISELEKRDSNTVNLENPNVPLDGFTLSQVLSGQRPSTSGVLVSPENSLRLSAVWRCVNILSGIISSFKCRPYFEDDKGARTLAKDHPTYKLFSKRPNPLYTKTVYWERAVTHLLLRGNHYSEIVYGKNGVDIDHFNIILPTLVKEIKFYKNKLWYTVTGYDAPIPMERMIHVPHLGEDPISGKSVITYAREDLGMEMARRDQGGRFWQDGGKAQGLLMPTNKLTDTQKAQAKQNFREAKREGGDVILPFGFQYINTTMTPADQEFIMSGNFSIASICRWFGVPLHKLSELDRATFNNVEQMAIEFLQDTISPIIEKIENEYETKCYTLPSEDGIELEFDMNGYLRADSVARAEANASKITYGYMSPNEAAIEDGRPPIDGGDRRFIQGAMVPLDKVDQQLMKGISQPKAPGVTGKNNFSESLKEQARALLEMAEMEYKTNGNGNH
jgi:HK97 family phage portal protein